MNTRKRGRLTDAEIEATLKESFADLADFRLRLDAKRTEWIRGNLFCPRANGGN